MGSDVISGIGTTGIGQARVATWLPTITCATPGDLAVTYTIQDGLYIRQGQLVHVQINIACNTFTYTTASGAVRITLPFTPDAHEYIGILSYSHITFVDTGTANPTQFWLATNGNGTGQYILMEGNGNNVSGNNAFINSVPITAFVSGTGPIVRTSFWYSTLDP